MTRQWPFWYTRPCGTPAAYRRHLRHHERVDEACRRAHAEESKYAMRKTRAARLRGEPS